MRFEFSEQQPLKKQQQHREVGTPNKHKTHLANLAKLAKYT